jgi:hypothetical protein
MGRREIFRPLRGFCGLNEARLKFEFLHRPTSFQRLLMPPSTTNSLPTVNPDSSEARKTMA